MKKVFIIICLLFLTACTKTDKPVQGEVSIVSDVSAEMLIEKYELATEIKTKYQLDNTALKRTVKDDWKDTIKVTIGEEPATTEILGATGEFTPKVTISRWDEVSLSLKPKNYDQVATKDKTVKFEGDKTIFETPEEDYKLYELPISEELPEGGFEYEIDLKSKPANNVIEFTLETQGLDFFYQPALTQQEIDDRASRPENVVGSYVVYASENKVNYVGGKEYKAGQVGFIYRPKIIDSAGTEVWGILNIDKGILSVTIPQDFLDKAVYPVRHAAGLTFGYVTLGGSILSLCYDTSDISRRRGNDYTTVSAGTVDKITVGLKGDSETEACDVSVFINDKDNPSSDSHAQVVKVERANLSVTTTAAFFDFTAASEAIGIDTYILNAVCNGADAILNGIDIMYNATGNRNFHYEQFTGAGGYAASMENPWTETPSTVNAQFSIYATYTPYNPYAYLNDGLIGYWTLDNKDVMTGKVKDMSGKGSDGSPINIASSTFYAQGKIGQGAKFDGVNDYVELPTSAIGTAISSSTGVTFSGWVNYTSLATGSFKNVVFSSRVNGGSTNLFITVNNAQTVVVGGRSQGADGFQSRTSSATISTGWHHIVGVLNFTGDTVSIYLDGVLDGTTAVAFGSNTYSHGTPTSPDRIGNVNSAAGEFFTGRIDDVRIFNRALSAGEIYNLYRWGLSKRNNY